MQIKNFFYKIIKSYTAKIFSSFIFVDIAFLFKVFSEILKNGAGGEITGEYFLICVFLIPLSFMVKFFTVIITFLLEVFYIKPDYDSIYINKKMMILETISIVIQLGLILTLMIAILFF